MTSVSNHPGRIFIPDGVAAKPWRRPFRVERGRKNVYRLVDHWGTVVRRFNRFRYAMAALAYLSAVHGEARPTPEGQRLGMAKAARARARAKAMAKRRRERRNKHSRRAAREFQTLAAENFWKRFPDA